MPSVSTPLPTWRVLLRLVWVYVRLLLGALFKPRWLIRPEPHWQSLPMPLLPPAEAHATRTLHPHKLAQYKQLVGWASDTDPLHAPKPPGTSSGPAISTSSTGTHAGGSAPGAHAPAPARAPGLQQQGGHAAPVLQRPTVAAWGPCVLPAVFLFTDAFPLAMEVLSQLPFSVLGGVVNKRATHRLLRPELPPGTHLLHRAAVTRDVRLTRSGHTEFDLVLATAVAQSGELVYEATLTMVLLSETATKKKTRLTAPTPPTPPPSLADVGGETGGGGGAGAAEAGEEEQPTLHHQPEAGRPVLGTGMGGGVLRKLSAAAHELAPVAASALTSAAAPDVAELLHELGGTRQGQEEGARPGTGTGVTGETGAAVQQGRDVLVQATTKQEPSPSAPRAGAGNHSTAAELSPEAPGKAVVPEPGGAGAEGTSQGAPEQLPLVGGFRLKGGAGRAWAALDGDISPMHLWPWTARLSGFPRPVANVQLLLGSTETLLRSQGLVPPSARPVQISAEFKRPCLLPQELVVHAGAAAAGATGGSEVAAGAAGAGGCVGAQAHDPRLADGGVVAFVVAGAKDGRPFAVGQAAWGTAARS